MLLGDNDAEGEPDPEALLDAMQAAKTKSKSPTKSTSNKFAPPDNRHVRREEEEDSEPERPLVQTASAHLPQPRKPPLLTAQAMKASVSGKNTNKLASLPPKPQPTATTSKAPAKPTKSAGVKRERPSNTQDDLPKASPPKRTKTVTKAAPPKQPPKEDFVLELPTSGGSSAPFLPPAPVQPSRSQPPPHIPEPEPEPQPVFAATLDDSDEEEWDDVMVPVPAAPVEPPRSPPARVIVLEEIDPATTPPTRLEERSEQTMEEDEDDFDALDRDLQEQLFEDMDMGMGGEEDPTPGMDSQPLNEDDNIWGDDDDDSSSDDSDDD